MRTPNPLRESEAGAWDVVFVGGLRMPGQAVVAGAASKLEWEEQAGTGTNGGSLKYKGSKLSEFEIELRFWEAEQIDEWETKKAIFDVPKGEEKPRALDFGHPVGTDLDIKSIVVLERPQLTQLSDDGLWGVTIKVKAWGEPEPKTGSPKKSEAVGKDGAAGGTSAGAGAESSPEDEADQMIKDLMDRIDKEAAK